jgi:hypothetical protein
LPDRPRIYVKSVRGEKYRLAQGEIISNLVHVHVEVQSLGTPAMRVVQRLHPHSIVLSQACELDQDYLSRQGDASEDKKIPCILFCEVGLASGLKSRVIKSDFWKRISQNNDERYHFFEGVHPELDAEQVGLPELGVDFKRLFAVPTDEVYWRLNAGEAQRRCSLDSPYLEHFCRRFTNFLSRVALPEPHLSV